MIQAETAKRKRPRSRPAKMVVNNRILRRPEAEEKLGLRSTMFDERRQNDPKFPKAVKLSKRALGWLERELDVYLEVMARERV